MLKLESKIGETASSDKAVYDFLSDFNNFKDLIPADKVKNWESTSDTCRFQADVVGDIGFKIIEKEPYKLIKVTGDENSKFDFFFWVQLKPREGNGTWIKLTLHANINAMMQMMAKKPLKGFLDMLVDRICGFEF